MKRLVTFWSALAALGLLALSLPAYADSVIVPMNQQINLGYTYNSQSPSGDAIYPAFNADTQTIYADGALEPEGFTRHHLLEGGGAAGWWYQYVDLNLAGITTPSQGLNLSAPDSRVEFDTRFFHDPQTNTNPYADAPVFLRIFTYDTDGDTYLGHRDYSIVYATQSPFNDPPYPTWTHVTVDVNTDTFTEGGAFDPTNVSRVRFYGTNWAGTGDDFVDFKNLQFSPVPIPVPAAVWGGLALLGGMMTYRLRHGKA